MCGSKEGPQNLNLDYFETEMRCQKEALPEKLQLEPENTAHAMIVHHNKCKVCL